MVYSDIQTVLPFHVHLPDAGPAFDQDLNGVCVTELGSQMQRCSLN